MNEYESYGHELTGIEEHLRDEGTWEDYYSEAFGAEARALDEMYKADMEAAEEEWEARQANPFTSECLYYELRLCCIPSVVDAEDAIPF